MERLQTEKTTLLKNPYSRQAKGKGIRTARFLVEQNIDVVGAAKKMEQSGPGYVFADAGVATAGLMIYITADELIPNSCAGENHQTIFSLLAGIVFVVLLRMI